MLSRGAGICCIYCMRMNNCCQQFFVSRNYTPNLLDIFVHLVPYLDQFPLDPINLLLLDRSHIYLLFFPQRYQHIAEC